MSFKVHYSLKILFALIALCGITTKIVLVVYDYIDFDNSKLHAGKECGIRFGDSWFRLTSYPNKYSEIADVKSMHITIEDDQTYQRVLNNIEIVNYLVGLSHISDVHISVDLPHIDILKKIQGHQKKLQIGLAIDNNTNPN